MAFIKTYQIPAASPQLLLLAYGDFLEITLI